MYAVTGRDAQIIEQSRSANPTTTGLEARSVLRNRTLKIKPLDAWDVWIGNNNLDGNVATSRPRKKIQRVPSHVSCHRDTAASKAATCARERVSMRRPMIVFSHEGSARLTDLILRLGHDCEVRIYRSAQERISYPADEVLFCPLPFFRCEF